MKTLLDTNIIIHRENTKVTNQSIGLLFYWLDRLHYDKMIHPYSINELRKYADSQMQGLYDAKLSSYVHMKTIAPQTEAFKASLKDVPKSENDEIDNQLLCEVYSGRVDILITEDRRMRNKSAKLGISDKVFSINAFIEKATAENPELIGYKHLSVGKQYFGEVDIQNPFFDSLRDSYSGFDDWFAKKSNEEAYICYSDNKQIQGFLYLKTEGTDEDYHEITPPFAPRKRLKIGTFKVDSTGFRLGERFIKIIFDNAIERNVDEIYVTIYDDRSELVALKDLLIRWGFYEYGIKESHGKQEQVLVKKMREYNPQLTIKQNFPNVNYNTAKRILPIFPQFHTNLLPDSQLKTENEVDFMGDVAHRYALQKVYVTWGLKSDVKPGDIILFYRTGENGRKAYTSVITTIGVIDEFINRFDNKTQFLDYCENRSVFSKKDLNDFWDKHRYNISVVKFIYINSLVSKVNLQYLWNKHVIEFPNGPRPFTLITNEQFEEIIEDSNTKIYKVGDAIEHSVNFD